MKASGNAPSVWTLAGTIVALGICAPDSSGSDVITKIQLEVPGEGGNWWPDAMSGNGFWVVGQCVNGSGGKTCIWNSAGQATTIDNSLPGYPSSAPVAINGDGFVVGTVYPPTGGTNGRPFRWSAASGTVNLGVPNGAFGATAFGASTDTSVIVGAASIEQGTFSRNFRWTSSEGMNYVDVGVPTGADGRSVQGVSGDGSALIGRTQWHNMWDGYSTPFIWSASNGAKELGALPGCRDGYPHAANWDARIVVGVSYENNHRGHAFRWTTWGGMEDLGALRSGWSSEALHVSADGSVVFGDSAAPGDSYSVPWVWTRWTGMQALSDYLTAQGLDLSQVSRFKVAGVSADAKSIVITCFDGSWNTTAAYLISSIGYPTDQDGDIRCWGDNYYGQCRVPADAAPAYAVAAFDGQSVALRTDGTIRCWGSIGTYVPPDLGPVTAISAGGYHMAVLQSGGSVRCWGNDGSGQCSVPPDLGIVSAIAAGGYHTVALKSNHVVRCWGFNDQGQCSVPADLGPARAIAAGWSHTAAVRTDGTVRCWGRNAEGQCDSPPDLSAVSTIAASSFHTVALRTDRTIRCWGSNSMGQCNTPADLGPVTAIAAGAYHTVVLQSDGSVRCWGYNYAGQCNVPGDLGRVSAIAAGASHTVVCIGRPLPDTDGDGVPDFRDNCPNIYNPDQADCNQDGIADACEIAAGAPDANHDGIPDACQCLGDVVADGRIDGADLGTVLSYWGPVTSSQISQACDLDKNGIVNGADLGLLLSNWGACQH
jgi:uncharacterized membrane protein